ISGERFRSAATLLSSTASRYCSAAGIAPSPFFFKSGIVREDQYYESPEISGHECAFDVRPPSSASYRGGRAGAQLTAQSERIRSWLVANRFHAISQASMMSAKLRNTELASQWLRR